MDPTNLCKKICQPGTCFPLPCKAPLSKSDSKMKTEDLKSELAAKDHVIHCLQEDLRKALYDRDHAVNEVSEKSSIVCVLKKQLHDAQGLELKRAGEIANKDILTMKLQTELQLLEQCKTDLETEV